MKRLNFGCGKIIKKNWVNVDLQKADGVDYSFDFEKFPYPLKENYFNYILIDNVMEHLLNLREILLELYRINDNNGLIEIKVPYYNCAGAYNDHEHCNFFNRISMMNLLFPEKFYSYSKSKFNFELVRFELIPTNFGKIFPKFIREKMSHILGEIYSEIRVIVKVKK